MGGKTSTSTQSVSIPKWVRDRYMQVNQMADTAASRPFQVYSNDPAAFVAQLNQQQQQGIQNVNEAAGAYKPYFETATGLGLAGMGSAQPQDLNLDQFYNPFQQQVIDATMRQMGQANEQAQSGALGQAASSGAFGGDRAGIAAANLANQQGMAMGSTLAGLNAQNYNQALAAAQQQQGLYLGATQADLARLMQGGQFMAGLGTAAQQAGLQGAEAQINAGTLAQQTEQAGLSALYNQFQQQQAYPFQVAQFLANIAMGTGALSGSTTTTTQPSSWFSDRRLKEDIRRIGHTDDGMPIYKYKYKGDENHQTHIGFMADEVEQVKPEAVGVSGGYKTVDYDRATKAEGGGVVGPYGAQFGSQSPYAGGYVPQAILPVGQLMIADSNLLDQSNETLAQQMQAAANFGNNIRSLKKDYTDLHDWWNGVDNKAPPDPTVRTDNWRGGVAGYATGGPAYLEKDTAMAQPVQAKSYLSDTVDGQEKDKKANSLQTAGGVSGQQQSGAGQLAGLLGGAGAAMQGFAAIAPFLGLSDRRTKHDIRRIGHTDDGMPIYKYKYKGDENHQTHIGFMADEVEKHHPDAVMTGHDGYKRVDYSQAHKFYQGGVVRPAMQVGGTPPEDTTSLTAEELMRAVANNQMPPTAAARLNTPAGQPMPEVRPVSDVAPGVAPAAPRVTAPAADAQPSLSFPTGVAAGAGAPEPAQPLTLGNAAPALANPTARPGGLGGLPGDYTLAEASGVLPAAPAAPAGPNRTAPVDIGTPAVPNAPTPPAAPNAPNAPAGVAGARVDGGAYDFDAARNFYRNNILRQESGGRQFDANGNPLTSPAGAVGIGQVMEATGPEAAALAGLPWDRDRWLNDAEYNAAIGEAYFLEQYRRFGALDKAAAAYNAGPGALSSALDRATGVGGSYLDYLPEETQNYVAATTGMGGGTGMGGSRARLSTSGMGGEYDGGVSPAYMERNALGKMMYDPRTNKFSGDALLSLLSGLGTMASSPSRYLGSAILQGIGGAASTYAGLREQSADVTEKNLANAKAFMTQYLQAQALGFRGTAAEYADTINYKGPLPGGAGGGITLNDGSITGGTGAGGRSYMGVPLDPFGRGLNQTINIPGVGAVQAGQHYGYLRMLESAMQEAQTLGYAIDPAALADVRARIAAHRGQIQTPQGLVEDPSYVEEVFGANALDRDATVTNANALTLTDDLTAARENVRNTDALAEALSHLDSTGPFAEWYAGAQAAAGQLGLSENMDYATAMQEAKKSIAEMARGAVNELAGSANTEEVSNLIQQATPSGVMTTDAIEKLLAIRAGLAAYKEALLQKQADALLANPAANIAAIEREFSLDPENKPARFIEAAMPNYRGMFVPTNAAAAGWTQEDWRNASEEERAAFMNQ